MPLSSYTAICPGGYTYEQRNPAGVVVKKFHTTTMPLKLFVSDIQKLREMNKFPRSSRAETFEDVEEEQCRRLNYDPAWVQKKTNFISPSKVLRSASAHVRVVATLFSNIKSGARTLLDWSDDGFAAVPAALSQARADICTGRISGHPCPHNINSTIKIPDTVAGLVQAQIEKKNGMKLTVEGEADLHICKLCLCILPLKVHVPLPTILAQMTPDLIEKFKKYADGKIHDLESDEELFYPNCWINTETQTQPVQSSL